MTEQERVSREALLGRKAVVADPV